MTIDEARAAISNEVIIRQKFQNENNQLKKLLSAVIEDIQPRCDICSCDSHICTIADSCNFKWRYADEAEKALEERKND